VEFIPARSLRAVRVLATAATAGVGYDREDNEGRRGRMVLYGGRLKKRKGRDVKLLMSRSAQGSTCMSPSRAGW
jgi:hypothetical protein